MIKSIVKEVFIILLLIVAIALLLGILFYEYIPTTKKVPSQVATYELSQEMKEELNETLKTAETQNIVKTYRVDSSDLKDYERKDKYNKGKTNPFDAVSTTISNETNMSNKNETPLNQTQGKFLNTIK